MASSVDPERGSGRLALAKAAAACCLVVLVSAYLMALQRAVLPLLAANRLLALTAGAAAVPDDDRGVTTAALRRTLPSDPFSQALVNLALIGPARDRGGRFSVADIALLRRLGWRDNSSVQNLMFDAGQRLNLAGMIDATDALLRRDTLVDESTAVLALASSDPRLRGVIAARLHARPPWRLSFLQSLGRLRQPLAVSSAAQLIEDLQRRGEPFSNLELEPVIGVSVRTGLLPAAYRIWSAQNGHPTSLLGDADFKGLRDAVRERRNQLAFDWQLGTGDFDVDPTRSAGLAINWDGRGVPIFAKQQTGLMSGAYTLDVMAASGSRLAARSLRFSFICRDGSETILASAGTSTSARLRLRTETPLGCGYPVFAIGGALQDPPRPVQETIAGLRLFRVQP